MSLVCGIDEAGRGPLLGPLVMCAVVVEEKDEARLKSIGAKDSKLLTPKTREILFDQIKAMVKDYKIIQLSPKEIDNAVDSNTTNLNWLEADAAAEMINSLNADKVLIDCPSNNPKAYKAYLKKKLKNNIEIVCEHKADTKYTVVAAASILAKVTRDREIEKIKRQIKVDFGSGYPSDSKAVEFLQKNWSKYPELFRKSWSSYKKVSKSKSQSTLKEF